MCSILTITDPACRCIIEAPELPARSIAMTQLPYQPDPNKPNFQPNQNPAVPSKAMPANPNDPQAPKGRDAQGNPVK